MRILAIRGENLASLAEPFALEFEREPLRSTGLFAITGETGAGKSTLLDALCLALYDKFPRVASSGGAEGAPDPYGEMLAAGDPRVILRRGAGRGFAEADFVARDGLRYRARCDLARARGGAAGRLQKRVRSLWRIDENGERLETIEAGVEPVNAKIIALTDLTFEQFRRTALLAQGDFDAFLRAGANERGDLLEKITGAEIYSRLSLRAYEKAREAREAVELLEGRRREIGGLSEEARAAALDEIAAIETKRAALGAERAELVAALRRLDAQAHAQRRLVEAQAARDAVAAAFDALVPERATLDALLRVEPLRAPRQDALNTGRALQDREQSLAQAITRAETAGREVEAAQAAERLAAAALSAATQEVARHAPLWAQAAALDARIEAQRREVDAAAEKETHERRRAEAAAAALADARAQEEAATREGAAARKSIEELEAAKPLGERWLEIDDWLEKRAGFALERATESELLRNAEETLARLRDRRRALEETDAADRAALGAALAQIGERDEALSALDAPAVEARHADISRMQDCLQTMARTAREHAAAQESAARAAQEAIEAAQAAERFAARLDGLREERAQQAMATDDAERLGELADAAADRDALRLRVALQDGEACPVCGAADHPFAHAPGAAQELIATLRARRDAARQALAQIDEAIAGTGAALARAQAQRDEALRREADAQTAMRTARDAYAAARAVAPSSEAPLEIAGASARLDTLLALGETQRESCRKILATAQALARDIAILRKLADAKARAAEERRLQFVEIDTAAREAGEARARAGEARKGANGRVASLDRALAPFLARAGLASDDLDRDAAGARSCLETLGQSYARAAAALREAEQKSATLAQQIAALAARAQAAAEQGATTAAAHANRRGALVGLQEERAALLGGEATTPHRARFEAAQETARRAHEATRTALAEAGARRAAADEGRRVATLHAEQAREREQAARAAFDAALATAAMSAEAVAPLLDLPARETAALREKVEAAREALKAAEAAVAARERDLAEAEAAGLPETPRDDLAAREAALTQEIDELLTTLGVRRQQVEQDDAARQRAADLTREIETSTATRRLWDDINDAIGSREGDKFRRFAQSVTLEHLVALANQRLSLLAPRYRLERGGEVTALGLQIVDRDLGDERRSTRSLSGGERFLASLALALALAGLEGRDSFVDTLFIDEGFGALDQGTLDVAIDALETLQGQGRKVGVISHVDALQSRIATKICVERRGGGVSVVRLRAPGLEA